MTSYLHDFIDTDSREAASFADELPLWSAPFGQKLLEVIPMKKGMMVLDIGFGTGFPMLEIAQRLGPESFVVGIDPAEMMAHRTQQKIAFAGNSAAHLVRGVGERLPFEDRSFHLVVSNNGINNVADIPGVFNEILRVSKPQAKFLFTMNLDETMKEFYQVFEKVLAGAGLHEEIRKMHYHIYEKRKPLPQIETWLHQTGFKKIVMQEYRFRFRYVDGTAMFNHGFLKANFLPAWKNVVPSDRQDAVFQQVEDELNHTSASQGELRLTVPWALIACETPSESSVP